MLTLFDVLKINITFCWEIVYLQHKMNILREVDGALSDTTPPKPWLAKFKSGYDVRKSSLKYILWEDLYNLR